VTPDRWQRARKVFDTVIEQSPSEADAYLRAECAGDDELMSEVRRMLQEYQRTGTLDHPPWDLTPPFSVPPPVFSPGQLVAGRYRIVRYLSRGGMGEVYEAEHPLLPDHVALKTLLPAIASDEAMIARFKQEIQLARRIAHPNVCKVFDLEWHEAEGAAGSTILFLTMEFLQGETLSSRIHRDGRMNAAEALPLIEQMAEALDAAHRSGVIHRDFKTSNVMLVPSGSGVRTVVTDFGLARGIRTDSESTATLTNNVAGTLAYMAPELLTGSVATFRSDLYALGVVAYEMMTGALPFADEAPLAAAFLRAKKPIPSPRTKAPDLDPRWERAILRALDPDPGRRYSEVREFPRALRGEPVSVTVALPSLTRRKVLAVVCVVTALSAGWMGWRTWSRSRGQPTPEAARLYQQGVDDIHAGAYFAATKALGQAVQLAPTFSPARARLAESWLELDLPEKALREFQPIRRQDNSSLPKLDQLQIDAVDLTITREFAAALAKHEEMRKLVGADSADLNVDLGRAYEKAGKGDLAIEAYRRAAEGPWHSAAAWLRLGVLHSQQSKVAKSEEAFAEADRRYRLTSNLEGLTEVALQSGVAANRRGQLDPAAALLRKAIELAHDAGNIQQEISARLVLANNAYAAGETNLAEAYARESLATAQASQMEALTIRGFVNLGNAYLRKGDLPGARKHLQDALALARLTNSARLSALSLFALAALHDRLNESADQIRDAQDALDYYQPNHWVQQTFQCLTLIGRGELDRGNYAAALDSFRRLLANAEKAQNQDQMTAAQENLGDIFFAEEQYPQALDHYQEFLRLSANVEKTGYAGLGCGKTLWRLGQYIEADAKLKQAEEAAKNFPQLQLSIVRSRAEMLLSQKRWPETAAIAQRVLSADARKNPLTTAALTRILGLAWLRSGKRDAGRRKCEEALGAAQALKDPSTLLDARMAVLEARLTVRDSAGALSLFHDVEPALKAHPESRWRALAMLAELDRQYLSPANEASREFAAQWGDTKFRQYLTRQDVQALSWPLLHIDSAKH
jgi:tetratricopeptide (TPR) repeat protein